METQDSSSRSSSSPARRKSLNSRMGEISKQLRKHGYKVTEEYDDVGLSKVSGEPPLGKTWWDWLQFSVQVLAALALPIALFVGAQQFSAQQAAASQQAAQDQQQEAALQSYLDRMSDLLLGNNTGNGSSSLANAKSFDEISQVARARTLTVLRGLDGKRKGNVVLFLYDARLIGWFRSAHTPPDDQIIDLSNANLSGAELPGAILWGIDLHGADLGGANLQGAQLREARLFHADLRGANLQGASLEEADLTTANLRGTKVNAEELNGAKSLDGTIMPDGTTHP